MIYTILIADDEPDIREFIAYNLKKEGYRVLTAVDGIEAVEIARTEHPHLILMDVMMPRLDGIEACARIRESPELQQILIMFLTARSEDYSQLAGFGAGGDEYVAKPVSIRVLLSRIQALLRRGFPETELPNEPSTCSDKTSAQELSIDRERYLVTIHGEQLQLPRKEFELLNLLYSRPDKVFTREEIFSRIWGDDVVVGDRTIDVHIRKLREKLGDDYIGTVKGVGYKFHR